MEMSKVRALTREELYALVWAEPMLKIAARYGISSSYLARVCTRLHVPRPPRGYWAQLEVGKAPAQPKLPEPRPGDELIWQPGGGPPVRVASTPKPPDLKAIRRQLRKPDSGEQHVLLRGAKSQFESGRVSYDVDYLKPAKRLLVDVIATKSALDKALSFANRLLLALEARGHHVVLAPTHEQFYRAEVDVRERESRAKHYLNLWSPGRPTIVYIGTVAIGLTFVEMTENVPARYIDGTYIRESEYVAPAGKKARFDSTWTTNKELATGRLCLQAYSPYRGTNWTRQWREVKPRELNDQVESIIAELERSAAEIARQAEDAIRLAAIEHARREAQWEQWRKEEIEKRAAQAVADSKQDLIHIINEWARWQSQSQFFAAIEEELNKLDADAAQVLRARITRARDLIAPGSALEILKNWKMPEER